MSVLLDTNAASEPGRPSPDPGFMGWYAMIPERDIFLSALTMGEIRRGVALLEPGARRRGLEAQYTQISHRFAAQILPIDEGIAVAWGDLSARLKREGKVVGIADELIAATALARGLTVVTRNRRHFMLTGCDVFSPWTT